MGIRGEMMKTGFVITDDLACRGLGRWVYKVACSILCLRVTFFGGGEIAKTAP